MAARRAKLLRSHRVRRGGGGAQVIHNPQRTVLSVFLIPYDVAGMPPLSRTFLRQRTVVISDQDGTPDRLRHAVHVSFVCTRSAHVYLQHAVRVAFYPRIMDSAERTSVVEEGPGQPRFASLSPDDALDLHHRRAMRKTGHGARSEPATSPRREAPAIRPPDDVATIADSLNLSLGGPPRARTNEGEPTSPRPGQCHPPEAVGRAGRASSRTER